MRATKVALLLITCLAISGCIGDERPGLQGAGQTKHAEWAREVVRQIFTGDYAAVRKNFDETMTEGLSESRLAEARRRFEARFGSFEDMGEPEIIERGSLTVVNIPLHMSKREGEARVTYDEEGLLAGLWLLRTGVPLS